LPETTGNQYYRPGVLIDGDFEWDHAKAVDNFQKHGVQFVEAVQVFQDSGRIEQESPPGNDSKSRWKSVGQVGSAAITVIFTLRGEQVRIISARKASRRERRAYGSNSPAQ
jgi:uncharacterized DUF497 family protein